MRIQIATWNRSVTHGCQVMSDALHKGPGQLRAVIYL